MTDHVRIDDDMWDDHGKIYYVVSYKRRPDTTAVELELQIEDGTIVKRVVPIHQIEWVSNPKSKD